MQGTVSKGTVSGGNMKKTKLDNRKLVTASILGAITVVLGMTPLGLIPLGVINATTMHIPVIIAAIVEGPAVGALVGLIFGLSSLANAFIRPTPIAFVFYNPLISILPRILIGIVSYYAYHGVKKASSKNSKTIARLIWILISLALVYLLYKDIKIGASPLNITIVIILLAISIGLFVYSRKSSNLDFPVAIGAFAGSMTNTILVLGGIYLIYAEKYVEALNIPLENAKSAILGVSVTSGIPEAIFSMIITTAVVKAVKRTRR